MLEPRRFDGPVQHAFHGPPQPVGLASSFSAGRDQARMQPGLEQRFVGVDVADAGHDALIEQHGLETARGRRDSPSPVGRDRGRTAPGPSPRPAKLASTSSSAENSVALPKRRTSRKRNCPSARRDRRADAYAPFSVRRPTQRSIGRSCRGGTTSRPPSSNSITIHLPRRRTASTRRPSEALFPRGLPRLPQRQAARPRRP